MNAHQRLARALRDAAEAVEEIYGGERRPRRRRGLLPLDAPREIPPEIQREVDSRLAANGYRSRK